MNSCNPVLPSKRSKRDNSVTNVKFISIKCIYFQKIAFYEIYWWTITIYSVRVFTNCYMNNQDRIKERCVNPATVNYFHLYINLLVVHSAITTIAEKNHITPPPEVGVLFLQFSAAFIHIWTNKVSILIIEWFSRA